VWKKKNVERKTTPRLQTNRERWEITATNLRGGHESGNRVDAKEGIEKKVPPGNKKRGGKNKSPPSASRAHGFRLREPFRAQFSYLG